MTRVVHFGQFSILTHELACATVLSAKQPVYPLGCATRLAGILEKVLRGILTHVNIK
jgi:hypothetical protein